MAVSVPAEEYNEEGHPCPKTVRGKYVSDGSILCLLHGDDKICTAVVAGKDGEKDRYRQRGTKESVFSVQFSGCGKR